MRNFSIKTKLWLLSGLLLGNLIILGTLSYKNQNKLGHELENILSIEMPAVKNMVLVDMMHDGLRAVALRAIVESNKDEKVVTEVKTELQEMAGKLESYLKNVDDLPLNNGTKDLIAKAKPNLDAYVKGTTEIVGIALQGKRVEAIANLPKYQELFEKLEKDLAALSANIENEAEASKLQAEKDLRSSEKNSIFLIIICIAMGTALSYLLITWLVRSVESVVSNLTKGSKLVDEVAIKIAESSRRLSDTSSSQSSALQETAAAIEEISAILKKGADNSLTSTKAGQNTLQITQDGQKMVVDLVKAVAEISQSNDQIMLQTNESNNKISQIVSVISEIGKKTEIINDIVFQTKLLSFNASVEAARAGEHGKGFAVVAEEVGNLAEMSGKASKEISQMLNDSINKVNAIVDQSKSSVETIVAQARSKAEVGTRLGKQCGVALDEIVGQVTSLNSLVIEISNGMQEQSQGISEIAKAMDQLDKVNTSTTSLVGDTSEHSERLKAQSTVLNGSVEALVRIMTGNQTGAA